MHFVLWRVSSPSRFPIPAAKIIACILFFTFGIITLKESTKEENSVENLIHRTRQELGELDANNDYKLMNDEIETNFESNNNDQIRLSSTLRSTSSSSENEKKNNCYNTRPYYAALI